MTQPLCVYPPKENASMEIEKKKNRKKKPQSKPEEQFKQLLEREKQLEQIKQGLIVDEYKGQLEEIETKAKENYDQLLNDVNEVACQTSPPKIAPAPSARAETNESKNIEKC